MIGSNKLARSMAGLLLVAGAWLALTASVAAVELPVETVGFAAPGGAADGAPIQRVNLGLAGTTTINTIVLTDASAGFGGEPGVFSGYDLDAYILGRDGGITTAGDREAVSGLEAAFTEGAARPTGNTTQMPSIPDDAGILFGLDDAGSIKHETTSLATFDGENGASIFIADGFLSLGDGGQLALTFSDVAVAGGLYLIFGDVGGQGEALRVDMPGPVPLPGAVWLFLSAIAILFGISSRRSFTTV